MPLRPLNREQAWLLPPTLGELIPDDHPARFVAALVDSLDRATWVELGIGPDGEPLGAPAYHPRALLGVWLHGFMTGIRSSRKLEAACRDQVPYLWLTAWSHPDHNTLWRFYQAHREAMRKLLKHTVATALELRLVDLAVQALDGTKIAANAAGDRTYDSAGLHRLLERTEIAIAELEAQNEGGDDPLPPRLPKELQQAQALRQQVRDAMSRLAQHQSMSKVNLTDADAQLMKARSGIIIGYNAQAMVSPLDQKAVKGNGMLITAAEVVNSAADSGQLVPMLERTEESTGERAQITLADGGYHTAANLEAGERRGQTLVDGGALPGGSASPLLQGPICVPYGDRQLSLPSRPPASLPRAPQIPAHWFAVNPCLPCIEDSLPHLSGLRSLHQGQTWGTGPLDRAFRRVVAQTSAVDANRRGARFVCQAKGVERTHLRYSQRPAWSTAIPAAWIGQRPGGIRPPGHRFQPSDAMANLGAATEAVLGEQNCSVDHYHSGLPDSLGTLLHPLGRFCMTLSERRASDRGSSETGSKVELSLERGLVLSVLPNPAMRISSPVVASAV
jgi:transposase